MSAGIVVEPLSTGREGEWDSYVQSSASGTFFHLTGWKRVVEKTFGFRPVYRCACDGGKVRGILPLFVAPVLPFGRCLLSVPFAVYGGICADDEETAKALFSDARELLDRFRGKYLELRHVKPSALSLPAKDLYATFRRPIFDTDEANLNAIPRKERAEIRKGKKNGLASVVGGKELLNGFFDTYASSVHNLGSPVFPKALFRNLLDEFGERCRILSVFKDGKILSGVMSFFFKDQVMPYYGGALRESFSLSVNDVMYWDLMCHGREHGYKVFDFGRSKKETGPYRFKEHWGFVPEPLAYEYYLPGNAPMPNVSPSNPKFARAISIWKGLPLELTKRIGPPLSKYFP